MSERGMGAAVGQVPEYACQITEWVKEVATIPVLVKLTPNVADIRYVARAAVKGGADGLSLINTINSIMGVNLEVRDRAQRRRRSSHGGYCARGQTDRAPHAVAGAMDGGRRADLGHRRDRDLASAVEFLALGASSTRSAPRRCTTASMVEDLIDGLTGYLEEQGHRASPTCGAGRSAHDRWGHLNLNYKVVARIDPAKCIQCNLCHIACEDGAHQCIRPVQPGVREFPVVDESSCVGCNLCSLVCPVDTCITMTRIDDPKAQSETWSQRVARTGSTLAAWQASDTHHAGTTTGTPD
jgi:dihydropyrimidine dehydrogenase (NAD+) subunit PreA